ncbi:EscN/YscN/HrcN family type III secretion system ATPase [Burkholderia sp. Nafp2/4-1b]|uniref:EscN/YscN/HrcN family type III secretion system ATPase n=1 Tax=Burkholderia sp. Nafp2/4-1b TaxID=2116686 RepID=UPI000EF95D37|nr:EscN/YscN/HrcN family type III secretion system ATPase [Burkholderia sp. Nafp2/4-1b]RKT98828.1 EscN/YscN/HrcN family type III secretion system ATPase [Burkholderia sp. Nafp2/4-1b]
MRQLDCALVNALVDARLAPRGVAPEPNMRYGRVVEIGSTLVRAKLSSVRFGDLCRLEPSGIDAEVVAVDGDAALLSPFDEPRGISAGSAVRSLGRPHRIPVGDFLLGRVVDGVGRPLDDGPAPPADAEWIDLDRAAPAPLTRPIIDTPLPLGVRAIDAVLTCGRGQRIGIFAAAGGGKSTLLGMICDASLADVTVLALIGERGREVREFLEHVLTPQARARSVVVVSTSDRSSLERLKAAYAATAIAEHFRDQGRDVLLMMDSLTRFARAAREIGLAAGEKPAAGSYPPSFFARLPRLLERAGPAARGSITGLYTVLVEGDDMNEPVADEVRSILDGHIVLSRKLAQANHYPAIDIGASVSRVMSQIVDARHLNLAARIRRLDAVYRDIELLVRVGEYEPGRDSEADDALARRDAIRSFLCQSATERSTFEHTIDKLWTTVDGQR